MLALKTNYSPRTNDSLIREQTHGMKTILASLEKSTYTIAYKVTYVRTCQCSNEA